MNQVADNPYVAPEADLEVQHAAGDLSVFNRFSTWGLFGLALISFGIYNIYWLYNRTQKLNSICENPIPKGFMNGAVITYIAFMVVSFLGGLVPSAAEMLAMISGVLNLAVVVLFLVWAFKFRNRLNQITHSEGKKTWAGPIMTFFFNVLYLNYKINQNIDERNR